MEPAIRLEVFRCVQLTGTPRLTRGGCAAKYSDAEANRGAAPGTDTHARIHRCRGCSVGASHAAGERAELWADGSAVEVTSITRVAEQRPREVEQVERAEVPREKEQQMAHPPRMVEIAGVTKTLAEWCETIGIEKHTIYKAAKRSGLSVEDEIAARLRAAGEQPASAAEKPARSAPAGKARRAKPRPPRATESKPPIEQEVRDVIKSVGLVELAKRLGYGVEDLGVHPRGRLLLVVEG